MAAFEVMTAAATSEAWMAAATDDKIIGSRERLQPYSGDLRLGG